MPKYKEKTLGDFSQWKKAAKEKGYLPESVFRQIFEHYCTMHSREKALGYAIETAGKVEEAAGLKKKAGAYTLFEHEGTKIPVPDFLLDVWVKKAKKEGIVSLDLHDNYIGRFLDEYTDVNEKMDPGEVLGLTMALDVLVAQKAGIEVDPKSPITFESYLTFKEKTAVFFSEIYGSREVPFYLYYKWLGSFLSEGKIGVKTNSEMHKYAKTSIEKEPSLASFDFMMQYFKFIGAYLNIREAEASEKADKEYPEYFVNEMEELLKGEAEKLAKLDVKIPKEKAGSISKIHTKGRIMLKLKGWDYEVGLDPDIYHLVYSGTVKNKGKPPSWANHKLYSFLVKKGGYDEDTAANIAPLLVDFFRYQVASDSEDAKKLLEKEKKLKTVPKK